jgi:hypothetical protein
MYRGNYSAVAEMKYLNEIGRIGRIKLSKNNSLADAKSIIFYVLQDSC